MRPRTHLLNALEIVALRWIKFVSYLGQGIEYWYEKHPTFHCVRFILILDLYVNVCDICIVCICMLNSAYFLSSCKANISCLGCSEHLLDSDRGVLRLESVTKSPATSTVSPRNQMHQTHHVSYEGIFVLGCSWQPFLPLQSVSSNFWEVGGSKKENYQTL